MCYNNGKIRGKFAQYSGRFQMEQNIHILIVDDEPDIRNILRILLEAKGYTVSEAQNGAYAVQAVRDEPNLDLIIMDIMMPQMSGVEASEKIRTYCAAPILFLTAKTQERDKLEAYASGGDDYLAKPFSQAELMMKVDSLLRRYRVYKGKDAGRQLRADIVLDTQSHRVLRGGKPLDLTETEFEILSFLSSNRGKVVSVEQIYAGVWKEKYMPSSANTVMVHIVNLRKKLEDDPSKPQLIHTVWGKGYQLD